MLYIIYSIRFFCKSPFARVLYAQLFLTFIGMCTIIVEYVTYITGG